MKDAEKKANLFIVFTVPTTRLHQDEAFSTLNFILIQSTSLSVFNGQIISLSVEKFERREDFA